MEEAGLGSRMRLLICDNASTDQTREVLEPLLLSQGQAYIRNEQNLGLIGNYCRCLELATTDFVWVVGDDDEVDKGCVSMIGSKLAANPHVSALFLNPRRRDGLTGGMLTSDYYPARWVGCFEGFEDAKSLLGEVHHSAWLWITGSVLAVDSAQRALRSTGNRDNLAIALMIPMLVACSGKWEVSSDVSVTMVEGGNSWSKSFYRRLYAIDIPSVLRRIKDAGYDFTAVPQFRAIQSRRWKSLIGDFRRRGVQTLIDLQRL
jgi:glycosyltransferase involved in cell wall biosynthesis